ncbi:protein-(glutamine-N5) methyltransferase, release factor-specific [Streptomyces sp. NRRL F-4489]|uniref:N5-glutamine methyltransferase family protein n=1 Tax=Streptomyces sp. NRRL F-4489 TaxID=1609095 RepID=UPI0007472371|nr:HemK/PrmC family methyltransferase [Streptomyces sp. NRRL F-4489]KUL35399.1 protein-(glutamine-N5) methyltransferase, release factor-specific [Streptomyces sp. NRRL F-4489]
MTARDRTPAAVLAAAVRTLTDAGMWAPREDAEKLLAHAVRDRAGTPRADELPLSDKELAVLDDLLARRAAREPVEYLTGRAVLGGVEVAVGPGVFIPRKHTEPLLAWGLRVLRDVDRPLAVDLCTGSAAIALAVAHARPEATVHAVELDPTALTWARRNAARRAELGDTPLHLHAADVTDPALLRGLDGTVDLLLANPPFVVEGRELPPEWQRHQPWPALFSGTDGLVVIRAVVAAAARLLRPGGGVAIEHDDDQAEPVMALLREQGVFTGIEFGRDHWGSPRYTTARRT